MDLTNRPLMCCDEYEHNPPSTKRTHKHVGVNDVMTEYYEISHSSIQSEEVLLTLTGVSFINVCHASITYMYQIHHYAV